MIAKILFVVGGAIVLLGFILCPWLDLFGKITGLDLLRSNLTVRDPITGALNVGLFLLGIVPIAGSFDVAVGYMQHPTRLLAVVAVILSIIGGISLANWAKDMNGSLGISYDKPRDAYPEAVADAERSEEHTSELQSLTNLVCRLLLE